MDNKKWKKLSNQVFWNGLSEFVFKCSIMNVARYPKDFLKRFNLFITQFNFDCIENDFEESKQIPSDKFLEGLRSLFESLKKMGENLPETLQNQLKEET